MNKSKIIYQNTIVVELKTNLTRKSLRENLRNLFRRQQFSNVQYVSMIIKFEFDYDKDYVRSLGIKYILDLKNSESVNEYISYLLDKFDSNYLNAYDPATVTSIHCNTYLCNKTDYSSFSRYQNSHKLFTDDIKLGVKAYLNMPFNNIYSSWGNTSILSKDESIINNINFNSDIEFIKITEIFTFNRIINGLIIFKSVESKPILFTDTYCMDGSIKREYSQNNKSIHVFIFNPNTSAPVLYLDKNILPIEYKLDKKGKPILEERNNIITELKTYSVKSNEAALKGKEFNIPKFRVITLDIETYIHNNEHKLLCICFFDGVNSYKFYRTDYSSDNSMLSQCFNKLLCKKYAFYSVYIQALDLYSLDF